MEENVTKKCKYCQSEIDKQAKICPNCKKKKGNTTGKVISGISIFIIGCALLFDDINNFMDSTKTNTVSTNNIFEMKLNEPLKVSNKEGEYLITFEGVRETSDRNMFSDITPNKVIFIDYNYENISSETDVYVHAYKYKVLDDEGNVLDTYPVFDGSRNNNSVPIGGKSKGTDAYAVMNDTKTLTILYYDYGTKPIGKLIIEL